MFAKRVLKKRSKKSRRGFTLVELLVVLLILSLLLAVVIPVVTQQRSAADGPRVGTDLAGIRDAIGMFQANVNDFPGDLEDLVNKIDGVNDRNLTGATYSALEQKRWKGPYLELALATAGQAAGTAFTTGFDAAVQNPLTCYAAARDSTGNRTAAQCTTALNNDSLVFEAVMLLGLGQSGFNLVNQLIDGPGDTTTTAPTGLGNPTTGRLRRRPSGLDTTFYLAVPIPK